MTFVNFSRSHSFVFELLVSPIHLVLCLQPEACRFLNTFGKKYAHTSSLPVFVCLFYCSNSMVSTGDSKTKAQNNWKTNFRAEWGWKTLNLYSMFSCVDVFNLCEQFWASARVPVACCCMEVCASVHVMLCHDMVEEMSHRDYRQSAKQPKSSTF